MRKEEMKEILGLLNTAGMNPQLCNYKVHVSNCPAMCGLPTMPGDDGYGEGVLVPEELLGFEPELFIPARGDSMAGAGFADGDLLRVRLSASAPVSPSSGGSDCRIQRSPPSSACCLFVRLNYKILNRYVVLLIVKTIKQK